MSFDVAGERTDLLQVVLPEEEAEGDHSGKSEEGDHGDQMGEEYDLALTAEGAEALNEVAGDDAFAEGDVSATTDDGNTAEQLTRVKGAGGRQAADAVVGSWLTGSMRPPTRRSARSRVRDQRGRIRSRYAELAGWGREHRTMSLPLMGCPVSGPDDLLAAVRALVDVESRLLDDKPAVVGAMQRLCRAAARAMPAAGVAISLIAESGTQVTVAASGARTEQIEEVQFALGEGPCLDAFATRRPVITSDLRAVGSTRWPGYAQAVQELGVRAVFAFPLQVGGARMGAMDVYRDQVGGLSAEALARALTFAEVATAALLDSSGMPDGIVRDAVDNRYEVFQAQGMVMIQLGVTLAEAIARIRAHAYAQDRRLHDVANDIVVGRLVLEADEP